MTDPFPKITPELYDELNANLDTTWPHDPAVPAPRFIFTAKWESRVDLLSPTANATVDRFDGFNLPGCKTGV